MSKISSFKFDLILVAILSKPEKTLSDSMFGGGIEFKSWLHLSRFGPRFPSILKCISSFFITLVISFRVRVFTVTSELILSLIARSSFSCSDSGDSTPSSTSIYTSDSDVIFSDSLTRLATIDMIVVLLMRPKFKSWFKLSSA